MGRRDRAVIAATSTAPRALTGADIYRVSCRPCHTADGSGAMPEVRSLLYPVQSASVPGCQTTPARLADRSTPRSLGNRHRAPRRIYENDSRAAVTTCRHLPICRTTRSTSFGPTWTSWPAFRGRAPATSNHGAACPRRRIDRQGYVSHLSRCDQQTETPATALNGVIPSLASIGKRQTQAQVARKLREGTLVPLHSGGQPKRQGRMPVLGYLSDADIASVYQDPIAYPPK